MKKPQTIKSIFDKYHSDLLRFIASKYGNRHDTEDIAQDAYYRIMRAGKVENLENARAYLYQTANNLALNRIEKENNHKKYIEHSEQDESTVDLENRISAVQELEHVETALEGLAEKYRKTFTLSRVQAKSYKEISEELGIPVPTVEKHIIKVLKHLRKHVKRG